MVRSYQSGQSRRKHNGNSQSGMEHYDGASFRQAVGD